MKLGLGPHRDAQPMDADFRWSRAFRLLEQVRLAERNLAGESWPGPYFMMNWLEPTPGLARGDRIARTRLQIAHRARELRRRLRAV